PVSPVSTPSPGAKARSSASIRTTFRIASEVSMAPYRHTRAPARVQRYPPHNPRRTRLWNNLLTKLCVIRRQGTEGFRSMTVLTIRAHKRYAVRQPVTLRRLGGGEIGRAHVCTPVT